MAGTIDDTLAEPLAAKVRRLERELEEETDRANGLESDLEDAEQSIEELKDRVETLEGSSNLHRIVDVRKAIKAGRIDDALYDLEKVLDTMDDGRRTWWCL